MKLSRTLFILSALLLVASSALAHDRYDYDDWSCSPVNIRFGDLDTYVSEESLDMSGSLPLVVEAARNGGIRIRGTNAANFRISVCKAVGAWDEAEANAKLAGIHVVRDGGKLSIDGPGAGSWVAHFRIEAPRGATLDVSATNGPIGIENLLDTDLTILTRNGPIGLHDVSGKVHARAKNGPISLTGGSGEMDLDADNGPLSIDIDDAGWIGLGLEARTENGPLTLHIPRNVGSGIVVETDGHSPIRCDPDICDGASTRWSRDAVRFELGSGPQTVHMSTHNGPLTIQER